MAKSFVDVVLSDPDVSKLWGQPLKDGGLRTRIVVGDLRFTVNPRRDVPVFYIEQHVREKSKDGKRGELVWKRQQQVILKENHPAFAVVRQYRERLAARPPRVPGKKKDAVPQVVVEAAPAKTKRTRKSSK